MNANKSVDSNKSSIHKSNLKQLNLLLWKNFKIQQRSVVALLIELLIPAFLALVMVPLRSIVNSVEHSNFTYFDTFNLSQSPFKGEFFAYQPNNSALVNSIMKDVSRDLYLKTIGLGLIIVEPCYNF